MSNTTTWDKKVFGDELKQNPPSLQNSIVFVVAMLMVLVAANAWLYLRSAGLWVGRASAENKPYATESRMISTSGTNWDSFVVTVAAIAGICGLIRVLVTRQHLGKWQATLSEQHSIKEDRWKAAIRSLQEQLAESKIAEGQREQLYVKMQEQVTHLTQRNSALQEELDRRKLAQLELRQHREELVRSKDVLAMHVQARTEQVEKLQQRHELILNSAGEGICGLDTYNKVAFANPAAARITGWQIDELIGQYEDEIFGKDAESAERIESPLKERILRRRDGTAYSAELVKTSIQEDYREVGSVLIFKDITERKRADMALARKAEELARSNAELEQFAFVASHDLQEPLRKIQAFGDRLKAKCEAVQLPEPHDYLERMQNAAARMQTLINDLLSFSRVIRSSQPFVMVDLGTITREVLGDLEVRIEKTNAVVEMGDMPKIAADPMQMRQLMQNLISNALKFQPPDSRPIVKIEARITERKSAVSIDRFCEICVRDNGIGFDEKYIDRIFAVFQRLHGRSEYRGHRNRSGSMPPYC